MSCEAMFCSSRTTKKGVKIPGISFHTFPKCPDVRNMWIRAISRKNWEPTKFSRLCSKHFEKSCFLSGLKLKKLKSDAVPTIFEGYPTYLQPVIRKQRRNPDINKPNPLISQTSACVPETTYIECRSQTISEEVLTLRSLLNKFKKVEATSHRRLNKIKMLRESRRRALKKIASLENALRSLKTSLMVKKSYNAQRQLLEGRCVIFVKGPNSPLLLHREI